MLNINLKALTKNLVKDSKGGRNSSAYIKVVVCDWILDVVNSEGGANLNTLRAFVEQISQIIASRFRMTAHRATSLSPFRSLYRSIKLSVHFFVFKKIYQEGNDVTLLKKSFGVFYFVCVMWMQDDQLVLCHVGTLLRYFVDDNTSIIRQRSEHPRPADFRNVKKVN